MKKKWIIIPMTLCVMTLLFGCGGKSGIKVGKYKGLELEKIETAAITDEEVEAAIRTDLQALNKSTPVNGPAQMWDDVVIDYVGTLNGEAFEGGTDEDFTLSLGSNTFIDGFEEKIVGHSVGETFDIDLTFPESYGNATLAGQDVVFTITLDSISRLPELTDELLPEIGTSATTVAEYKEEVKKQLETSNEESRQASLQEAALTALVEICEVKTIPEEMLIRITKDLVYQESYGAIVNNLSIDDAVLQSQGMSVEEKVKELATKELAVEYIAEKEDLVVSEQEYEEQVTAMATSYGETDIDAFVTSYEMVYGEGYIKRMMLQEKVGAFLVENCKEVAAE